MSPVYDFWDMSGFEPREQGNDQPQELSQSSLYFYHW